MQPARTIKLVLLIALITAAVSLQAQTDQSPAASKNAALVSIELKDLPVKDAIDALFQGTGRSYFILPGVTGRVVDLKLKGITFDEALKALTDAAGLAYTVEDGVYTVGPVAKIAVIAPETVTGSGPGAKTAQEYKYPTQSEQPKPAETGPKTAAQPPTSVTEGSPTTVIVNEAHAPVYYGHPAPQPFAYNYNYPPIYRFGNVSVVGGGYSEPVVVAGGGPYVFGFGPMYPPPPGWVSPEVMRFLRGQWAIQQRPYFITPYPY